MDEMEMLDECIKFVERVAHHTTIDYDDDMGWLVEDAKEVLRKVNGT